MVRHLSMRAVFRNRITIGLLLTALLSSACSGDRAADRRGNSNTQEAPAIAVTTARVEARNVPAFIQATGSLIADETSDVAPKVAGKVANVSVDVGDFVTQGAVIAKIDDSDARRQLAGAQARVKQEIAAVRQAEAKLGLEAGGRFNASRIPEVRAAGAAYEQAEA